MDAQDSIGVVLRRNREERGLTLEQAALQSKVPLRLVQALESDDYHLLPDPLYLVRLLHEYGVFLALDPAGLEAEFRAAIRRPPQTSLVVVAPPRAALQIPWKHVLWTAVALVVVTPLVFIALSLASKRAADRAVQPQVVLPGSSSSVQVEGERATPGVRGLGSVLPSTLVAPQPLAEPADVPARDMPDIPGTRNASAPVADSAGTASAGHVLLVRAQETTWMSVRADGKERRQVLLQPGQTARFDAETRLQVTVGNAGGVALWLDGTMLPALGRSGDVVRDLILPAVRNDSPSSGPALEVSKPS
jgi:cytoskeleton protein RodZ